MPLALVQKYVGHFIEMIYFHSKDVSIEKFIMVNSHKLSILYLQQKHLLFDVKYILSGLINGYAKSKTSSQWSIRMWDTHSNTVFQ